MTDRIETIVVVTDKGSQTFQKVGTSAEKMGTSIDKAGQTGERGLTRLNKAGAATAAGFTTLGSVIGIAARANAEAEASHARLETAIDNTGHSLIEYQDQLDAAGKKALQLGFDDEDAADSIAKLTTATGDAQKAINDLSIAEDISRARKISLEAATNLVIAAEQGRTGALIRAGVQVDATMTKEQLVDALRAKYAGNAEAYSQTSAAGFDRVKNAAENMFESFGSHLGPFQTLVQLLPGLSAGTVGVSAAMGALAPEMTGAAVAAGALNIALGPVGVAALAIGAALALYKFAGTAKTDFVPSIDSASSSAQALDQTLKDLIATSSVEAPLAKEVADSFKFITGASNSYESQVNTLTQAVTDATNAQGEQTVVIGKTADGYPIVASKIEVAQKALDDYIATESKNKVSAEQMQAAQGAVNDILRQQGPAGDLARDTLEKLFAAEQAGTLYTEKGETQWQAYLRQITEIGQQLPEWVVNMQKAGETTAEVTGKAKDFISTATGWRMSIAVLGDEYTNLDGAVGHTNETIAASASDHEKVLAAIAAVTAKTKEQTDTTLQYVNALGELDTFLKKLATTSQATVAIIGANKLINSTNALGSAINVIIDGTKNLGSQSSGLNDWAMQLINVKGSVGEIDTLLANHQITLTTYNQAQQAQVDITAANTSIQEDLLRIQTKQAPLLADLEQQQAKYIDTLADLPATQQLVQLGWMDSAESLKAQNALQLAAAASAGDLGEAGKKAAESAITAAAQADPVLEAMLTDMGLISVGADGTITMNFPDAETVQEAVDGLTASIDALTLALGGVPPSVSTTVTANTLDASLAVSGFSAQLDNINGKQVYTSVYVDALGPGLRLTAPYQLGGVVPQDTIPHAQNGMVVTMNEAGPEMVRLPSGSLIYPAGASKEMANRMGRGSGQFVLHNPTFNIYANSPNDFADQMRAQLYGSRS